MSDEDLAATAIWAAAGASPRPVMVLAHGTHGGGWQFRQVGAILDAKGWTAYRPTLSGSGEPV